MITYLDKNINGSEYTVLFNKASAKLGLAPIIEEVRNEDNHETEKLFYKRAYDQSQQAWVTVPCFNVDGEGKPERDENGKIIFHGVDVVSESLLDGDGNPIKPITTLNEYFQHIRDLAGMAIGQGRSGSDPYFLRLPLDEPFFEINANTRGITVPGELSQIAVKGDKLAEIVFFRIDRYYDAVDLNTRHIYIEWEAPDGEGGVRRGISRDFLRDTQSEKDKIIFGWAIGDELTQHVGTIRFAVRFVEWFDNQAEADQSNRRTSLDVAYDDTQLLYSFSSLPATISVVDSLNYTLFEDDEALAAYNTSLTDENIGTVVLYLEDSDSDSTDETAPELAAKPVFVRNLTPDFYVNALPIQGKSNEYKINLNGEGKLELRVEANAEDGGQISYVFGKIEHTADEGTGVAPTGAKGLIAQIKFIPAEGVFSDEENKTVETFNKNKTFYIEDISGGKVVVNAEDAVAAAEEGKEFFERVAWYMAEAPGHYYALADNRVGGKKANSERSAYFYIPWASKPVVEAAMDDGEGGYKRFVINELEYVKNVDTEIDQSVEPYPSNIDFIPQNAADKAASISLNPTITAAETNGLTYVWYKHNDNHIVDDPSFDPAAFNRPEGLKDLEWKSQEEALIAAAGWTAIPNSNNATFVADEPGCYAVKVENNFNTDSRQTNLFDAGICRVTDMPSEPTIANWDEVRSYASRVNSETIPEIKVRVGDHDKLHYEWHMITSNDNEDEDLIADGAVLNPTDEGAGINLVKISGENEPDLYEGSIKLIPATTGLFYLILTNELNGASAIVNTAKGYGKIWVQ